MRPVDVPIIESHATIDAGIKLGEERGAAELLVDDPPFGWSSLTVATLRELAIQGPRDRTIAQILPETRMPLIYPDNRLEVALRHIAQWPFLPVMHRADPKQLVGLISLRDIMTTFVE
jgi:CBS domain-containing protein